MLATIESFCQALPEADGCEVDPRAVLPRAFDAFANEEQLHPNPNPNPSPNTLPLPLTLPLTLNLTLTLTLTPYP